MSNVSKRKKEGARAKIKTMGDHKEFLKRISKTLYYGQLPTLPCLSLPVTEISCSVWSVAQRGRSLRRLHADAAAGVARSACVSPCALVLAILYLERLKRCNADYLAAAEPSDLFLVSLMVSNKFLQDDGEDDEVICSEWAASGGLELAQLKKLEIEFLDAIDWNVFVSEKSFESGLEWLERQVALKQARLHGFFTYTDLTAACDGALLAELLRACLAAALASVATLAALLTSTLVVTHVLASSSITSPSTSTLAPAPAPAPGAIAPLAEYGVVRPDVRRTSNDTIEDLADLLADEMAANGPRCCEKWTRYREARTDERSRRGRSEAAPGPEWKSPEPRWSRTSVLDWLYQSSLIGPLQRWLGRAGAALGPCEGLSALARAGERQRCARRWQALRELGASVLVASVADR